jgi:glycopeptide antibiotics resistance protein
MSRARCFWLALLYALGMAYASTFVGPVGVHLVPIEPSDALHRLLHMQLVAHGSDQRADWMGNLVMLVPLGFLMAGWCAPAHRRSMPGVPAVSAFVLCLGFILVVKYTQLYFPPRTVTLNYVIAQSLGAIIGIVLFGVMRSPLAEVGRGIGRLESLRLALRVYTALLVLFMLMPLDFALNADDIAAQLDRLPDTFGALSGEGRPLIVRLALSFAGILATAPVGALLTLAGRGRVYVGRSVSAASWMGLFGMFCVYVATTMVISGAASLPAVGFRTVGIALGAWFMHWLTHQDPDHVRYDVGDLVYWAVPVYLVLLFAVNGLLSLTWSTEGPPPGGHLLLPLFNYYIVSKAQAAKDIMGHLAMYAPIGVMLWLRSTRDGGAGAAFFLAALLSAIVEGGRYLRPGLVPDINAIPLAGIAAWGAASAMPVLWRMLSTVAAGRTATVSLRLAPGVGAAPAIGWRDRNVERRTRRRERDERNVRPVPPEIGPDAGDVEHY